MTTPARPPRDAYEEAERCWITADYNERHSDDTPAWPITASLLSEALHRFFTFILPAAAIGFLLLLTAWLAI